MPERPPAALASADADALAPPAAMIPVPLWPCAVYDQARLLVFGVPLPPDTPRERARLQLRRVLRAVLAARLALAPEQLMLPRQPGRRPRLAPPHDGIGLSLAHAPGLSLLAIHLDGPVGIDLLRTAALPADWQQLARDYLGPARTRQLAALPPEHAAPAFAGHWAALEALLKCHGQPLAEWRDETERRLAACVLRPLALPGDWLGSVVLPGSGGFG